MRKITILLTALFIYGCVFAQSYEITPASLYFNAEPGESQTRFLNVRNNSSKPETFILSIGDFNLDSKGKREFLQSGSIKQSIADWVTFSPIFFELQPNEEKEILVNLQAPADDYGSKWGILFLRTAIEQTAYEADKSIQTGLAVSARMGVYIYQTPGTNKTFQANITNLTEVTSESDSVKIFNALVNNLADIITPCKVYLIATNIVTAEETVFDKMEFMMFPKSARKIEIEMKNTLPKGTYSLAAILDYGSATTLEGTQMVLVIE